MTEHTKTDGLPDGLPAPRQGAALHALDNSRPRNERLGAGKVECNACPVLSQISPGRAGACDRYANAGGVLVRVDPVLLLRKALASGDAAVVPFAAREAGDAARVTPDTRRVEVHRKNPAPLIESHVSERHVHPGRRVADEYVQLGVDR